jgi:hypothetical protein
LIENENPKPVWNFVKSKRKGTNKLISLKVGNSVLTKFRHEFCADMNSQAARGAKTAKAMQVIDVNLK